ncbi:MAG: glycosyltransferase family 1 protein [Methanoregulaceae archaeon]|jgi:glycosyltransferase involved in cell wall biosynthesis
MKILYDDQIFSFTEFGGVSKYFTELMNYYYFNEIPFDLTVQYSNNQHLQALSILRKKPWLNKIKFPRKGLLIHYLHYPTNRKKISRGDFDVFHPTYFDTYFLKFLKKKPYILTIYDMIPEIFLDNSFLGRLLIKNKRLLMDNAAKIIAISQSTKNDILQLYNYDESEIEVVHLGIKITKPRSEFLNVPYKYLLFVGNRGGYKNFDRTIRAIAPVLQERQDLSLICAGSGNFNQLERDLFEKLNIFKQISHCPITDSSLPMLYRNALCFIFPSLYEGFGIPILEAFSNNCPVILSNTSSFPEVAEDAAEYFDPFSEVSIRTSVTKILDDVELRERIIRKGTERIKAFSIENMAGKTLNVYKSVL